MMKLIHSLISTLAPLARPGTGPALHFAGCLRTLSELSASGPSPWGHTSGGAVWITFQAGRFVHCV